jgi:hypothetical protein
LTVTESPETPWTLSVRIPAWCGAASMVSEGVRRSLPTGDRWLRERRTWCPGDSIVVDLDMPARVTEPDPRIDSVRGCVALERGPLVYCLETADLPEGATLEELELEPKPQPTPVPRPDLGDDVVGLRVTARRHDLPDGEWPYHEAVDAAAGDRDGSSPSPAIEVDAIPYYSWANRAPGAMRVWILRGLDQP